MPAVFYAPGALALLIQHLAVTFAALSLVRERELGLSEVFKVSPLGVSEALVGKYLAFTFIAGAVAAVLSASMIAFGTTIDDPRLYATILLLMILASLGLGFAVSGVARTDTQAVQYSMMILLVSIFFTGFVLPLEQLILGVRAISFLLPATYGILAMHDTLFRATPVEPLVLGGLALYAAVLAAVAWWAVRKDIGEAA
jgi:ABC-2 type transport system permease protein